MNRLFAKSLSIIFHPVLMPTLGIFIIFRTSHYLSMMPQNGQNATYLIVFVTTFVLPLIMAGVFLLRKVIKTFEMTTVQERFVPFLVTTIFYFFSFFTLYKLRAPNFITAYILGAFLVVLFLTIISVKWKISAHAAGLGGLAGMILVLADLFQTNDPHFFLQAIIAAGLVGTARLYLGAHNLKQIAAGFGLGVFSMMLTLYIYPV